MNPFELATVVIAAYVVSGDKKPKKEPFVTGKFVAGVIVGCVVFAIVIVALMHFFPAK